MRIVQTGSLSAAAEHSCLTVQALAAQLNKVEEQFGFRLFRRSNKGLTLTTQGTEHAATGRKSRRVEGAWAAHAQGSAEHDAVG
jgi:DNA-binding transcriptional LysR family regulator